ncbi:DUF378 domain-containing protein [Facilibium subflavum]|uniref:DUF378 domain-containing protein n=1 Tax=Facilibium subflavum TaxID=2219058 RepID=UPI000E650D68|nr:DUF378 domain-containing protein [Facilibium subflavum]
MRFINTILTLITIIGGFNWFLLAVFDFNIVHEIFKFSSVWEKVIYVVIGLSSLYCLSLIKMIYKSK